jgi:histidinol dehydrogenase
MSNIIYLSKAHKTVLDKILKRAQLDISRIETDVKKIIEDVRARGDKAIVEFYKTIYNLEIDVKYTLRSLKKPMRL